MTEGSQIYKCSICENMVEVIGPGAGTLVCCGKPMELLAEKHKDTGFEKHLPVIEKSENGVKVKVGSVPHPMEEKHFIAWIELFVDGTVHTKILKPGDKPEAEFCVKGTKMIARAYCNVHGLWSKR